MCLRLGELRVRGDKEAHRGSDGQHNNECDVAYLLHVRVPGVNFPHDVARGGR